MRSGRLLMASGVPLRTIDSVPLQTARASPTMCFLDHEFVRVLFDALECLHYVFGVGPVFMTARIGESAGVTEAIYLKAIEV